MPTQKKATAKKSSAIRAIGKRTTAVEAQYQQRLMLLVIIWLVLISIFLSLVMIKHY